MDPTDDVAVVVSLESWLMQHLAIDNNPTTQQQAQEQTQ